MVQFSGGIIEFKEIIIDYYSYHDCAEHNGIGKYEESTSYRKVREILNSRPGIGLSHVEELLGRSGGGGGFILAAKNSISGRHGGLIGVINLIAEEMKKRAVNQYVVAVWRNAFLS